MAPTKVGRWIRRLRFIAIHNFSLLMIMIEAVRVCKVKHKRVWLFVAVRTKAKLNSFNRLCSSKSFILLNIILFTFPHLLDTCNSRWVDHWWRLDSFNLLNYRKFISTWKLRGNIEPPLRSPDNPHRWRHQRRNTQKNLIFLFDKIWKNLTI